MSHTSKHRRGRWRESNRQPFHHVESINIVTAVFFVLFCFETVDVLAEEDVGAKKTKQKQKLGEDAGCKPGEKLRFEHQHHPSCMDVFL